MTTDRYVVRDGDGWAVKKPGADRASNRTDTQKAAIDRARQIVGNQGGGEVRIQGQDGKFRDGQRSVPSPGPTLSFARTPHRQRPPRACRTR